MTHGRSGYERHGCRCPICRAANTAKVAATRARRLLRLQSSSPEGDSGHGTHGGYDSGCRCEACRLVRQSRYWREENGPRRHLWREYVVETYRAARDAWEALREGSSAAYGVAGASGSGVVAYQLEDRQFRDLHPPPTLRATLVSLRWS